MSYPGIVFSFFLRGPCFTPHAACCLCMTSCVAGACVVFALLCCFFRRMSLDPLTAWDVTFCFLLLHSKLSKHQLCLPSRSSPDKCSHDPHFYIGFWRLEKQSCNFTVSQWSHCACVQCVCAHLMFLTSGKTVSTSSPSHLLLLHLFLLSVSSLPPPNRLAGSSGDWRKRPGVSTLSLWFGPTGRDSRYLPAPRRSHQQVCHLLDTPDFPHPPQGSSLSLSRRCPRDTSCIL